MPYDGYDLRDVDVDDGAAFVTIDNPPINLLDMPLIVELGRLSEQLLDDGAVRVVVVRSADPEFFVAHADVELLEQLPLIDNTCGSHPIPQGVWLSEMTPTPEGTPFPSEVAGEVRGRLRRVEGQIRGIQRMLDENRDCGEVVAQLAAAKAALDRVGYRLIAGGLRSCVGDDDEDGLDSDELESLFLQLS